MRTTAKVAIVILVACGAILGVRHANTAMSPSLPADMPANARFLPSGFDIADNEAQGSWVACREDRENGTDWCRVTDQRGMVVFEGAFLPLNSAQPLPTEALQVAAIDPKKLWVHGPAEQSPVPAIPLVNGTLVVPLADRDALRQRWSKDPGEYDDIMTSAR